MDAVLRSHAQKIIEDSIAAVMPDEAVRKALAHFRPGSGKIVLIAAGKAAWQMASTATQYLERIDRGVVITKYGHVKTPLAGLVCIEAGHPVPDEHSFLGTQRAIEAVSNLNENDSVLFLLSGGGSALFEKPLIPAGELQDITNQLLACGADIVEINTIRKRISAVKGGRFAQICAPAKVFSIVLSDIVGDPLDMIASGPAYPDSSSCVDALRVVKKYGLSITEQTEKLLHVETPKSLDNVETYVSGSVSELCLAAKKSCESLGYDTEILTDRLCCEARDAGSYLANVVQRHRFSDKPLAFVAGGETVVHLRGTGKGGRNQELALSAAPGLSGAKGSAVFSVGSDGTDGPTDAAGGYVDWQTIADMKNAGMDCNAYLDNNDAYHALKAIGGLIITGPTGTNVNDVAVALIRKT